VLSVVAQTYENIEIIIIDDNASPDWNKRVADIANSTGTIHPIKYIRNAENKGSAETRNIGIKAATGEYISFLDDDDIYFPGKIKNQLSYMLDEKSDYCITDLDLYDEYDRLVESRRRSYIKNRTAKDLFRYHLMYHMTGTDTMMFKRDYLLKIGGFPPINVGDEFYLIQKAIEGHGVFSYLAVCDIKAYIHTEKSGLSSGESKINGENVLYDYKKQYFKGLAGRDIRYIKMRHHAVLAYAEKRRGRMSAAIRQGVFSFFSSPSGLIRLFLSMQFKDNNLRPGEKAERGSC